MDISTIAAAYESLKASKELFRTFLDAKADAEAAPKIQAALNQLGEAQDTLFALREELFRLQGENDRLRQEISATKSWEEKLSGYELTNTAGGAIVYKYKGTPEHFACPNCANKHEIQILQDLGGRAGTFLCNGCKSRYPVRSSQPTPAVVASRGPSPWKAY